jgi:hypothetical protein
VEITLLARCYVPDPEEGQVEALDEFAAFALHHDRRFTDLFRQFGEAFPAFTSWVESVASAKNESGESSGTSGTSA